MKKASLALGSLLLITGVTFAQTGRFVGDPITGIAVSTDPTIATEVERRAQEIALRQQQMPSSGASGDTGTGATSDGMSSKPHKARKSKMHRGTPKSGDSHAPAQ